MNDYISRHEAIETFQEGREMIMAAMDSLEFSGKDLDRLEGISEGITDCIDAVGSIQAADVRPVVMCRDCKHSYREIEDEPLRCPKTPTELDEDGIGICAPVPDDFWCKYGEPKDSSADMRPEPEPTKRDEGADG